MEKKQKRNESRSEKLRSFAMVLVNVVLVLAAIIFSVVYSNGTQKERTQLATDNFCATVESMKRMAGNYLQMEENYVQSWATYIERNDMTMNEALAYVREVNTQTDRYAHIVDMDTLKARSTYAKGGDDSVGCYRKFKNNKTQTNEAFLQNMQNMFRADRDQVNVLGKYRIDEMQIMAISVGTRVTLYTAGGGKKDYLLLRVIPVESMRDIWVFPLDYASAEIGMITENGDYIIQSKSMKSANFIEFIRSYNFQDDYNGVDQLSDQLSSTTHGLLKYKDSKNRDCYWYYSKFKGEDPIYILGYIPAESIETSESGWHFLIIICVVFFLLLLIDGTYVGRINNKLRRTAVLAEQASEAKTRFLSSMSHDIRTPLNAIIGMNNIAMQHIEDPQYTRECLKKASISGKHLLTLVNNILDISKVESGNMVLNKTVFSVETLINNVVDMMRDRVEEKNITLQLHMAQPACPYLVGDTLRLNQICINLLANAVKYTNDSGNIHVDVREEIMAENRVRLFYTVSDSGIGMTEEFQKVMYETFARAKDSRIDKIPGSGLGLPIAKQMVELMDGTIRCESKCGEGTTFYVTVILDAADDKQVELYQKEEREYSQAEEETQKDEFKGMHVLVAEDNDLNWEIIEEMLTRYGICCDRAENGKKCVEMISGAPDGTYDMIFMDIQMPVMNGMEAARAIRENDRSYLKNIAIYAMTADAFAEDVQKCLDNGMDGHIAKPVEIKNVRAALRYGKSKRERERRG